MGAALNPPEADRTRAALTPHVSQLPGNLSLWFAEEVQPHEPMLRAWLRSRFPSRTDIDDLVQESYARLLHARLAGRVRNARNYLFATARHAALDLFRHESVITFDSIGEKPGQSVLDQQADVAETVCRNQELQLLSDAMQALPTRCRQVFTLRKLYGLSHREIALQLGISERTVEAQIDKAMRRCAVYLRAHGMT
jgi:RNA polymerase sigma factor (sigma-70 family)